MFRALHAAAIVFTFAAAVVPATAQTAELLPGVRVDRDAGTVEFDGIVPIKADAGDGTVVFLEVMVCLADSKEHESLVMTRVTPSHVHAALLALGLEPGTPGQWIEMGGGYRGLPADGPPVRVEFIYERNNERRIDAAASWVKNDQTGEPLRDRPWLFAGSRMIDRGTGERYDADGTGLLVGLATFGSELLAYPQLVSHEAAIEEPVWIADPVRTPPFQTPVTVRLTAIR